MSLKEARSWVELPARLDADNDFFTLESEAVSNFGNTEFDGGIFSEEDPAKSGDERPDERFERDERETRREAEG